MSDLRIDTYILDQQVVYWDTTAKQPGRAGNVNRFPEKIPKDMWEPHPTSQLVKRNWSPVFGVGGEASVEMRWQYEMRMHRNWKWAAHRVLVAKVRRP